MYAAAIRLVAGRYHATGWDHHVNEGTVEWPPSPLRLLRALVATGFKIGMPEDRLRRAVEALSGLPVYRVPPATFGHTRHYMPTDGIPIEASKKLVFDAFYGVARGDGGDTLVVGWPDADPDPVVRADLAALWEAVSYVGRAESWVECAESAWEGLPNVAPEGTGSETARLPALESLVAFEAWQRAQPIRVRKKGSAAPETLWDVLLQDTGGLQRAGWSTPPGVRWVTYGFRRPPIVAPTRRGIVRAAPARCLALFALSSAVPPRIQRTVSVADRIRRAAMSRSRRFDPAADRDLPHPLLAGKDAAGTPLTDHRHAFWLPFASDGGRILDRLLVWVRGGLDEVGFDALASLREVWGDEQYDIRLTLLGTDADAVAGARPLVAPARVWETDTPFVPVRHPKPKAGRDSIEEQIRRSLDEMLPGHPPVQVEPVTDAAHGLPWFEIDTRRRGGGSRASIPGVGVRLVFAEPVEGPIALGFGAHFGLGRFRARD